MKCQECGKDGSGDVCAFCGGTIEESPRWYAEGIAHLTEQRQYAIAYDLLEEGVDRYPQSAMLWYNGGVLEELMGNRDGAIRRYQQVLDLRPNNEKARKALERLLGRPLFTPPPTTSYTPEPAPAPAAPVATSPAPAPAAAPAPVAAAPVAEAFPPPMPSSEPLAAQDTVTPVATLDAPIIPAEAPAPLPMPELPSGSFAGLPWEMVRLITLIGSILFFLGMLTMMFIGQGMFFGITLVLFAASITLYFISTSSVPHRRGRR
jgi:hypothetical protein